MDSRDRGILTAFFDMPRDTTNYRRGIEKFEPGKFKPVISYLMGETKSPRQSVVELVAWLLDFPDRPFRVGEMTSLTVQTQEELAHAPAVNKPEEAEENLSTPEPTNAAVDRLSGSERMAEGENRKRVVWKWAASLIVLVVVAALSYFSGRQEWTLGSRYPSSGGCMRWVNDHFEETPCGNIQSETPVLELDAKRLQSFRRVFHPETLSKKQLKALWYINRNNDREYYTGGGSHPVDTLKDLNRMSDYMIGRYFPNAR